MPSWKKVVASGSDASFSSVSVDTFVSASSFKGSFTGSLQGTSSWAVSSSYALTASYLLNGGSGTSAIYVQQGGVTQGTASYFNFSGAGVTATVSDSTASIYIPGGGSGGTSNSSNAVLVQSTPATTWSFTHNLSAKYPVFNIYDSSDNVIIPLQIHAVDTSSALIYFSTARTGTAVASVAGNVVSASFVTSGNGSFTGSFTGSFNGVFTGSLFGSASQSYTASFAFTASSANSFNVRNSLTASGLRYPTTDGTFAYQTLQTDAAGNLTFGDVQTTFDTIYNAEATTIVKGTPVYVSGSQGANPRVFRADAAVASKMPVVYIVSENIASGATGRGITLGHIDGIDLTGYPDGTLVYAAAGGGWTSTRPTGSNVTIQFLGIVTKGGGPGGKGFVQNPGPATLPNLQSGSVWVGDSNAYPTMITTSSLSVATASYALTASSADTFLVRSTLTAQTLVVTTISSSVEYSSGSNRFGNDLSNSQTFTGSVNITGSLNVTGPVTLGLQASDTITFGGQTATSIVPSSDSSNDLGSATNRFKNVYGTNIYGNLTGTASYSTFAESSTSSSYAFTASSAISASLAQSASYVALAKSASYVLNAVSSSYSYTASSAISSSLAQTASYVVTAQTASYVANAISSSYAYTASSAVSSSYSYTASSAINANYAYTASSAVNASASLVAVSSSYALTASYALNGGGGGVSAIYIQDEGITQGTASYFNFTGAGVTATVTDSTASINITGGGSSGTLGLSTTFTQSVAATTWTFIHNLNTRYPLIQVYDTTYNQITPQYVSSSASDTVVITFGIPTAGYAVASNGGTLYVTGSNVILDQAVAAATWSFTHNLNTQYPIFQVFNSNNEVIIPERIVATDSTSSLFYFPSAVAGKAVASVGGVSGSMGSGVGFPFSGSAVITGSFLVSQSFVDFSKAAYVTGSFTGSLYGTSSWSQNAYTASSAISASYSTYAISASFAPGFTTRMSQSSAATTWSFTHNLNTVNPIVQVYDLTNAQIVPNQIVGMNNSTAEIRFDYAQAGYAVASNGGGLYVTGSTSTLVQSVGAVTWSFNHNLNNKYNTYEVYDNNDTVIIPSGIKAVDNNNAELYFSIAQAGRVVGQFSGINGSPNAATASYANTASFVSTLVQNVTVTGSLILTGSAAFTGSLSQNSGYVVLTQVSQSLNYADDVAAAAGGVPLGGLYRNGNFILIRLS